MEVVRVKAFKKLIEIAEAYMRYEVQSPLDIVRKFGVNRRTAYDYWYTIKKLELIFRTL